ncbi:MAG: hypothetical protein ACQESR_19400, partial [Planctomycetota bacterium]
MAEGNGKNTPPPPPPPLCDHIQRVAVYGCRYTAWTRMARMDATGLSRGGSRSSLQTGQKHYSWPSVAWNVTDHGTSPWHLHPAKP